MVIRLDYGIFLFNGLPLSQADAQNLYEHRQGCFSDF